MIEELKDLDSLSQSHDENLVKQWQLSTDLTSLSALLLGGGGSDNFHFGIQVKHLRGKMGYRFNAEFYPQSRQNWPFSQGRALDIVGTEILYLNSYQTGYLIRSGFGIERELKKDKGRSYIGVDLPLTYELVQVSAYNYWIDPISNELDGIGFNHNNVNVHNAGIGLVPFLGYEFYLGKRLGFNIEAKTDFNFLFGEAYLVEDNAQIVKSGQTFNFRIFPLLDFRIHYRI